MSDQPLDQLTTSQRLTVDRHIEAMAAVGARPRWCVAHAPGTSTWAGDSPCTMCEQAAGRFEHGRDMPGFDDLGADHLDPAGISDDFKEAWGYLPN